MRRQESVHPVLGKLKPISNDIAKVRTTHTMSVVPAQYVLCMEAGVHELLMEVCGRFTFDGLSNTFQFTLQNPI